MILTKQTWEYESASESEADSIIEDYKKKQNTEGFTVTNCGSKYKVKKDKKTGDIIDEKWITTVTVGYLI